MKVKLVLACLAVAGLAVSSAAAAPPEGKGKPNTGEGCKPRISVILKGTLTAAGDPLTVNVTSANHWGNAYVGPGKQIDVNTGTKVRGQGMKQPSELKAGFRVLIQARVCKADLANGATPALTATKVIAHDPSKAGKDENENKGKDDKGKDNDDDDDD
jgi:hypothetical protein